MKRWLTLICLAAMLLLLGACGGTPQDEAGPAPQNSTPSGDVTPPEEAPEQAPEQTPEETPEQTPEQEPSQEPEAAPEAAPEQTDSASGGVLIAYFSATGNTANIAAQLAAVLDAELYEIVPAEPYTGADLNYQDPESRSSLEHADRSVRPAISGSLPDPAAYDVIFLGYPIWWGSAPNILLTFLERFDCSGKTVVPFCTSGSSGIGSSAEELQALTEGATWLAGERFSGSATQDEVAAWVQTLALDGAAGE